MHLQFRFRHLFQNNWVEIFFPEAFEWKIFSEGENNPFSFPFVETYRFIYAHNILDRYYIIFIHYLRILTNKDMTTLTGTATIERFHSRGQHLCKFIGTKENVYIRKEFNSHRTGLGHQHAWPPFHCFGTPIWPPWRHVKTLYSQGHLFGLVCFTCSSISVVEWYACKIEDARLKRIANQEPKCVILS